MEKKELYKKAREYLGKTVSYGIGNIEFDYDRPDGKEYIYEESQDDEDMENFAVMDFLEDLLVDFTKQELDRAREEGYEECKKDMAVGVGLATDTEFSKIVDKIAVKLTTK